MIEWISEQNEENRKINYQLPYKNLKVNSQLTFDFIGTKNMVGYSQMCNPFIFVLPSSKQPYFCLFLFRTILFLATLRVWRPAEVHSWKKDNYADY